MRKKLIFSGVFIAIVVLILFLVLGRKSDESLQQSDKKEDSVLTIKSVDSIAGKFRPDQYDAIVIAIKSQIERNAPQAAGDYEIVYREGSFTQTTLADGYPKKRAVFDIPSLQRTFVVETEGDETTEYSDIRVLCPLPEDLKYKPKVCTDTP